MLGWVIWAIASIAWLSLILWLIRLCVEEGRADYRRRLADATPITPGNVWLLAFGAEVVKPQSNGPFIAFYGLVWLVGWAWGSSRFFSWWQTYGEQVTYVVGMTAAVFVSTLVVVGVVLLKKPWEV